MNGVDRVTGQPIEGSAFLRQRIADVLTTPVGSHIMRRDYGSRLLELIDMAVSPANVLLLYGVVAQAVQTWVGDFKLTRLQLLRGDAPGQFTLALEGEETQPTTTTTTTTSIRIPLRRSAAGLTTA